MLRAPSRAAATPHTVHDAYAQMLGIGRALMGNPTLLLLDEPSEGLSPLVVRSLIEALGQIREEGVTLLIADQNVALQQNLYERQC